MADLLQKYAAELKAVRGMSRAQVKELQQKIGVNPDGRFGSGSRNAYVAYLQRNAEISARNAARVAAENRREEARQLAAANEAKAKAELARARAETERVKAARERTEQEKQKTAQAEIERKAKNEAENRILAVRAAGIVGGAALGPGVAVLINRSEAARAAAQNKRLAGTVAQIESLQGLDGRTKQGRVNAAKASQIAQSAIRGRETTFTRSSLGKGAAITFAASAVVSATASRTLFADNELLSTISETGALASTTAAVSLGVAEKVASNNAKALASPLNSTNVGLVEAAAKSQNSAKISAPAIPPASAAKIAEAGARAGTVKGWQDAARTASAAVRKPKFGLPAHELRAFASANGITNASRKKAPEVFKELKAAGIDPFKEAERRAQAASPNAGSVSAATKSTASATARGVISSVAKAGLKALPFATPAFIGLSISGGISEARAAVAQGDTVGVAKAASNTAADIANTLTFGVTGLMERAFRAAAEALTDERTVPPSQKPRSQGREFVDAANGAVADILPPPKEGQPWQGDQSESMREIAANTVGNLYGGYSEPAQITARSRYQEAAAEYARSGSNRIPERPTPPVMPQRPPRTNSGGLRGFANPNNQKAAQAARKLKGYT